MARIVVTEFVSLDGVMEDPGGSENFKHGGWTFEISTGDDGMQFKVDETMNSEAMLLGRKTYEGFADAWPERDGEFADRFNSMPKYVVSSTLKDPSWTNTTVLDGDLPSAVARVGEKHGGDVVVHEARSSRRACSTPTSSTSCASWSSPSSWAAASGCSARAPTRSR